MAKRLQDLAGLILGQELAGPNLLGGMQDDLVIIHATTGYVLILDFHRIDPIEVLSSAEAAHASEYGSLASWNGDLNSSTETHRAQKDKQQEECQPQMYTPKDERRQRLARSNPNEESSEDHGGAAD